MIEELEKAGYRIDVTDYVQTLYIPLHNSKEFLLELAAKITEIANRKTPVWTAVARYDRGLGVEFISFELTANDPSLAQWEAEKMVTKRIAEDPRYEKAVVKEVRVRPYVGTERKA